MPFRPVRFDALVCSNTCAKRKSRGGDLAYLAFDLSRRRSRRPMPRRGMITEARIEEWGSETGSAGLHLAAR